MSYKSYVGAENSYKQAILPATPMLDDIRAAQYLYGPNLKYNMDNDVYPEYATEDGRILETIWDAGGIDTINASKWDEPAKINLNNGTFSEIGPGYDIIIDGVRVTERSTVAIAYEVYDKKDQIINLIKNATGGSQDDEIFGNNASNLLAGLGGNDTITGGMGPDFIATGPGADTLRYTLVTEGMDTIADFDVGSDKFDFSAVVGTPPSGKTWMDYIGLARSVQDGKEGTLVSLDPAGSAEPSYTMAFLQGVSPDTLTAGNFGLPDAPPPALPVLSIAMDVGDQGEGTGGTTDFTFKLTRSILAPCSVTYTVAGSGEQPADNADFVAEDLTGTVTFAAGNASLTKMITVRVNGDTEPEPDETFTVTLNNPSGATIDLAEGSAEGIIYNDDIASPPPVTFSVTPATQTVGEGDGAVTFTISRSDFTAAQTVYVSTVQDQGFQNNGDYEGIVDQPITFAAGDDQPQTVDVTIFDDSANPEVEPDETFSLLVEDTPGGIALASATFTIADDDATNSGSLLLVSTDKNGNPGNKGSHGPDISNDGLYIVYHSPATNIGDANGYDQVLMKNISTGSLFHVSTSETGVLGNSGSNSPSILNGAEYITFTSGATNFTENDTSGYGDVFVKNVATWDITCASQNDRGEYANGECYYPSISADSRYVAFYTYADNLVEDDTNGVNDIFVKDIYRRNG